MFNRDDVERSATLLIRQHGSEGASAWAEKRGRELLAVGDEGGCEAMLWIAKVIRRRGEDPVDLAARRRYRGDV
jgi:hypothetical protein